MQTVESKGEEWDNSSMTSNTQKPKGLIESDKISHENETKNKIKNSPNL
jgi:hypothetical protein